ncbi:MAG: hypothetical protein JNM17_27375 [Archangium sp.]|nr:hypothetical protein [Archangium sp.]
MFRCVWGIAVLLLVGCSHAPECRAHGGPQWSELRTPHFVIRTGLPIDVAGETALMLERAHAAVRTSFTELPPNAAPIEVLLLKNELEVQEFAGQHFITGVVGGDWRGPQLLLSADDYLSGARVDVPHLCQALALHFQQYAFRRMPRWFAIGFAAYLSSITIDPSTNTAYRGKMVRHFVDTLYRWGVLPMEALWKWDSPPRLSRESEVHHAVSAWVVVHYLENNKRAELDKFIADLQVGLPPSEAWALEFSGMSDAELRKAATDHFEGGQFTGQLIDLGTTPRIIGKRAISDAEVHASLARFANTMRDWERARRETKTALALDARLAEVQEAATLAEADQTRRLELARTFANAHPNDAIAHLLLALNLPRESAERVSELERAVLLDSNEAIALSELALSRLGQKQNAEAATLAERAATLAPFSARVLASFAEVLWATGKCPFAIAALERAIDFARGNEERVQKLIALKVKYETCAAPPATALR